MAIYSIMPIQCLTIQHKALYCIQIEYMMIDHKHSPTMAPGILYIDAPAIVNKIQE